MEFDLNLHFKQFANNLFFKQKNYSQLRSDVFSFSASLSSLTPHAHVALKIESPYLTMVALLACLNLNKLAVMLSVHETPSMIERLKSQIDFGIVIDDTYFSDLIKGPKQIFPEILKDSPALVVFSSGTTSTPKGIALSFNNLFYSALGFKQFFSQTDTEVSEAFLPHNHVGGLMVLWRAFFSGGKIETDPLAPVDFISLVPLQLKRMIEDPKALMRLKKIRVKLIGGAPLSPALRMTAKEHGLVLYETYGMSESTSLLTINGQVLPYREVQIDEDGFFNFKGNTLALGEFNSGIFRAYPNDWFKTKDTGEILDSGHFRFIARSDLIFISGGENINPLFVEDIVKQHPAIKDAYLIPLPDELWGEMGVLLFETQKDLSVSELKEYLKSSLHPHLIPRFFFATNISFSGLKPKRHDLKILAEDLYLKAIFPHHFYKHPNSNASLLVALHGFLGDKEDLDTVTLALRAECSILSIDLPGHGESHAAHFHSTADLLNKLSRFIKIFSKKPILYGYSMGGRVAIQLALSYLTPAKLIVESASLGLANEFEQSDRLAADNNLFNGYEQSSSRLFLEKWYSNPMFKSYKQSSSFKNDVEKKSLHKILEWRDSQKILSVGAFPLSSSVLTKLKKASFDMIYLYGEEDIKYKSLAQEIEAFRLPRFRLFEIPGAGHNPHRTHPLETIATISNLLK